MHSKAGVILLRILTALLVAAGSAAAGAQTAKSAQKTPAPPQETAPPPKTEQKIERRIVVSIPHRKLALLENGKVVKIYRVAVGAKVSPSPQGEFTIVHRIPEPTYYAPGVIIPPGADNPLGPRWIGLSAKGFGIHGTNQPNSIGRKLSHGCIRMRNRDVEDLFERVRLGDVVQLAGERTEEIAEIFGGAPSLIVKAPVQTEEAKAEIAEEIEDGGQVD